jgi:hypothetical protein
MTTKTQTATDNKHDSKSLRHGTSDKYFCYFVSSDYPNGTATKIGMTSNFVRRRKEILRTEENLRDVLILAFDTKREALDMELGLRTVFAKWCFKRRPNGKPVGDWFGHIPDTNNPRTGVVS